MPMWFAIFLLIGLFVLFGLMVLVGSRLDPGHSVSCIALFATSTPETLWDRLVDVRQHPRWRPDLKAVEAVETDDDGAVRWVELGRFGRVPFERVEAVPPEKLVTRIADPALAFGGTWTYELDRRVEGTRLTITERGEIREPVFRFLSRYLFNKHSTMRKFIEALAKELGEEVTIEAT
jgi:uncharacterized protein YndB with AHSA1/START domain